MGRTMTARKPTPIHCPTCASELAPAFIRKAANTLAASAPRPGSAKNTRNPYGRKGKPAAWMWACIGCNHHALTCAIKEEELGHFYCCECHGTSFRKVFL